MNPPGAFETSDLPLGGALVALDFRVVALRLLGPRRVAFCFRDSPELRQAVEDFSHGTLQVEPGCYFDALKGLKRRLFLLSEEQTPHVGGLRWHQGKGI